MLRCAYEESALWEVAAEVGGRERAAPAVRALSRRGLVAGYVESGWPRLRREILSGRELEEALERPEAWEAPLLDEAADVRRLHARTIGIALTREGARALQDARGAQ